MPPIVPHRFLVRMAHPCRYVRTFAPASGGQLVDLPETAQLRNYAELDEQQEYADFRLGWNENGIGLQLTVTGKEKDPAGDVSKPRMSDGLTLWIDTRGDRNGHRASRFCHQFCFLPAGGGPDQEDPAFVQIKINRALQDAPIADASAVPFRCQRLKRGYRLEAILSATVLTGFDPEQHPQLGVYYHLRDQELGEQYLGVNTDFPFADDPSLWEVLQLLK